MKNFWINRDEEKCTISLHFKNGDVFFRRNKDKTLDILEELNLDKDYLNSLINKLVEYESYDYNSLFDKSL